MDHMSPFKLRNDAPNPALKGLFAGVAFVVAVSLSIAGLISNPGIAFLLAFLLPAVFLTLAIGTLIVTLGVAFFNSEAAAGFIGGVVLTIGVGYASLPLLVKLQDANNAAVAAQQNRAREDELLAFKAREPIRLSQSHTVVELAGIVADHSIDVLRRAALHDGFALHGGGQRIERAIGPTCLTSKALPRTINLVADGLISGHSEEPCLVETPGQPTAPELILIPYHDGLSSRYSGGRDNPKFISSYTLVSERIGGAVQYAGIVVLDPEIISRLNAECIGIIDQIAAPLCVIYGREFARPHVVPSNYAERLEFIKSFVDHSDPEARRIAALGIKKVIGQYSRSVLRPDAYKEGMTATRRLELETALSLALLGSAGQSVASEIIDETRNYLPLASDFVRGILNKICPAGDQTTELARISSGNWQKFIAASSESLTSDDFACAVRWLNDSRLASDTTSRNFLLAIKAASPTASQSTNK